MVIHDKDILIIGQHLTSRVEAVRDYMLDKANSVSLIALCSAFIDKNKSHVCYYEKGSMKWQRIFQIPLLSRIKFMTLRIFFSFAFYVFHIIYALVVYGKRFDIYIGISHFSGLIGVILKSIGLCKKCIYYAIDYYAPDDKLNIFGLLFLKIENFADRMSVLHSDEVWDISSRIEEGRSQFSGISYDVYKNKHKIAPLGYGQRFFRDKEIGDVDRYAIVFVGVIVENQGLELILEALPDILKRSSGACECWTRDGVNAAMNRFNSKVKL